MMHPDFRSLGPQAQEAIRLKAMAALQEGRSVSEVARLFGVSRQAIHTWIGRRRKGGKVALQARRRGRPPGGSLRAKQERTICRLITDHCPDQLKLPFYLWTREAVVHLIAQHCGVRLSVWTAGRLLAKWASRRKSPRAGPSSRTPKRSAPGCGAIIQPFAPWPAGKRR